MAKGGRGGKRGGGSAGSAANNTEQETKLTQKQQAAQYDTEVRTLKTTNDKATKSALDDLNAAKNLVRKQMGGWSDAGYDAAKEIQRCRKDIYDAHVGLQEAIDTYLYARTGKGTTPVKYAKRQVETRRKSLAETKRNLGAEIKRQERRIKSK